MQVFGRRDFQFLYNDCFTEHDRGNDGLARLLHITDEGVFPDARLMEGREALHLLRWKPVHELAGPNKPSSSGPALPFPFTGSQLAAFMLCGWGSYFQDAFGRLDCGPNEFVLNGDHEDAADAYEALRQAYVIYRDALHVVGELDHQERQRAYDLRAQFSDAYDQALEREKVMERVITGCREDGSPEYGDFIQRDEYLPRLARAKESVATRKAQALQAEEQADAEERAWRKSMTRQLLQPHATTPSPAPVKETTEQRRARYLAMFEIEEKREKRGALQRVADSEGVDRANMKKDIDKARAARDEQKGAGFFVSQLVQDGKRKG